VQKDAATRQHWVRAGRDLEERQGRQSRCDDRKLLKTCKSK
jgi:hypothetical protein